jgi:hypothetical protein
LRLSKIHQVAGKLLREALGEQRAIAHVRHDPALVWTGILEYLLTQTDVEIEALRMDEYHSIIRPVHVAPDLQDGEGLACWPQNLKARAAPDPC